MTLPKKMALNFGPGEIFFHEVYVLYPEGFSVQIVQIFGIRGKRKG